MADEARDNGGSTQTEAPEVVAAATDAGPEPIPGEAKQAPEEAPQKRFYASIYPGQERPIPNDFAEMVQALERALDIPTWILAQAGRPNEPFALLDETVRDGFFRSRSELRDCQPVALLLDSRGGYATETYRLATLLRRHCGSFVAVVPRMAKSAATLLVLGADELLLGQDAELGPLDVQVFDYEEEESSALDEVQALERLNAVALDQLDQTMAVLRMRTQKKTSTLLPLVLDFTAKMMQPLLEKIETVHYAKQSRLLKVAEDYAVRLLTPNVGEEEAAFIARRLVHGYTEHRFAIGSEEASEFMEVRAGSPEQAKAIADLEDYLTDRPITAVGRIIEEEVAE